MNDKLTRKLRLRSMKEKVSQKVIMERALKMYLLTKPTDENGRKDIRNYLRKYE